MKLIVGNTGLVGKTLLKENNFDLQFNTRNINNYINDVSDYADLYLSCLPATKWLVNKNVQQDIDNIFLLIDFLSKKTYKKIILISTIDIYCESPKLVNESYIPSLIKYDYGNNRLLFEKLVTSCLSYEQLQIFRLPALFNSDIKKNIIFDLLNNNNVFNININSAYQWYNLDNLNNDLKYFSKFKEKHLIVNLFPEPVETTEIVKLFLNYDFKNFKYEKRFEYNYCTKFFPSGYIKNKEDSLKDIKKFVNEISSK